MNLDKALPHRPLGNLVVYCPACPEPGVNMQMNQASEESIDASNDNEKPTMDANSVVPDQLR